MISNLCLLATYLMILPIVGCKSENPPPDQNKNALPVRATTVIVAPSAVASAAANARTMAKMVLPLERTPLPTRAEWDAAPKLPTEAILGSDCDPKDKNMADSPLCLDADFWRDMCEIRRVREYTRVLCRPDAESPERPAHMRVATSKYAALDVYTFAAPNLLVAVAPNLKDPQYRPVKWSWTRGTYDSAFSRVYPHKEKWGTIFNTGSRGDYYSLQGGRTATEIRLCECQKEVEKVPACNEGAGYASDDCLKTYGEDCASLLACASGDPFHAPVCPPGTTNYGPAFRCYPACDDFGACPPGLLCDASGTIKICTTSLYRESSDAPPDNDPPREFKKGIPSDAIDFPGDLPEPKPTAKPPTVAEWKTGTRYGLGGILPCDVTTVREWLRLSCHAPSEGAALAIKKESGLQLYTTRQNEFGTDYWAVVGFVTQIGRGKTMEAELRVKEGRHVVKLEWPEGQNQARLRLTTVEIGLEPQSNPELSDGGVDAAPDAQ